MDAKGRLGVEEDITHETFARELKIVLLDAAYLAGLKERRKENVKLPFVWDGKNMSFVTTTEDG
jgi:hypothetical protein